MPADEAVQKCKKFVLDENRTKSRNLPFCKEGIKNYNSGQNLDEKRPNGHRKNVQFFNIHRTVAFCLQKNNELLRPPE